MLENTALKKRVVDIIGPLWLSIPLDFQSQMVKARILHQRRKRNI